MLLFFGYCFYSSKAERLGEFWVESPDCELRIWDPPSAKLAGLMLSPTGQSHSQGSLVGTGGSSQGHCSGMVGGGDAYRECEQAPS